MNCSEKTGEGRNRAKLASQHLSDHRFSKSVDEKCPIMALIPGTSIVLPDSLLAFSRVLTTPGTQTEVQ